MNSICKEIILPDNSQPVEFCPISAVGRTKLYLLVFHIKTLWFFKHCRANGMQLLHAGGLNTMPEENSLLRLLSSFADNINTLQSEINAVHALENIKTLNGTS